jgi:hypothetical protein
MNLAAGEPQIVGNADEGQHKDDIDDPRPDRLHHQHRKQQAGKRLENLDGAQHDRIDGAAMVTRDHADRRAD